MPRHKSVPTKVHAAAPSTIASRDDGGVHSANETFVLRVAHPNGRVERFTVSSEQTVGALRDMVVATFEMKSNENLQLYRDQKYREQLGEVGNTNEMLGSNGVGLVNGDRVFTKLLTKKAISGKRKTLDTVGGLLPPPKEKKKKTDRAHVASSAVSGGEFLREGKTSKDIAMTFMDLEALAGSERYSQFTAAARVHAVEKKKFTIEITYQKKRAANTKASSTQKHSKQQRQVNPPVITTTTTTASPSPSLPSTSTVITPTPNSSVIAVHSKMRIVFVGNGGKSYEEVCPCYSESDILSIFSAIISRQTTSSRRLASSPVRLLSIPEIARRSPPLLWSICHLHETNQNPDSNVDVTETLQNILACAGIE
eukprot:m.177245 g.177245  ORF g.177245 m.177245 type:complete len:368 (+) comp31878_c0_seq1:346-1449(+)